MKRKALFPILVLVIALSLVFSAPAMANTPGTILSVSVSATGVPGNPVVLTITETNTGDAQLYYPHIVVEYNGTTDTYDRFNNNFKSGDPIYGPGAAWILDPGESWVWEVTYYPSATVTYTITGHGSLWGTPVLGQDITYPAYPDEQKIVTVTIEEQGSEGLTPGFWKNHLAEWANTAYAPTNTFRGVFGVGPTITLQAAVNKGGGGENALGRHAVAALLNASHPGINYPMTVAQIIAAVQNAYATRNFEGVKNVLEGYNQLETELGYNSPNSNSKKPKK